MDIVNFGSMNLDHVYRVEHFVQPGETLAVKSLAVFAGGKGLNQSVAIARAGGRVCHAGCVGQGGERLRELLQSEGVDCAHLESIDDPQGQTHIQVNDQGQNCILYYPGSNGCLTRERIDAALDAFAPGSIVLLQNEASNAPYLIEAAHARGMKVVFNPSPMDESLLQLDFSKIWWLLINEVEGEQITGKSDYDEILAELRRRCPETNIVLTKGKHGVICTDGQQTVEHGIYDVPVVDSTGAGDTFTGYFLAGLQAGDPLAEVVRRASVASSLCVSRAGASPSVPTRAEVDAARLTPC